MHALVPFLIIAAIAALILVSRARRNAKAAAYTGPVVKPDPSKTPSGMDPTQTP